MQNNIRYILSLNKFGIKENYNSISAVKIHKQIVNYLASNEPQITIKQIQGFKALTTKLNKTSLNEDLHLAFGGTEIIITKSLKLRKL